MSSRAYQEALAACQAAGERWTERLREEREAPPARRSLERRSYWRGADYNRLNGDWLRVLTAPFVEVQADLRTLRAGGRDLARNNPHAGAFLEDLKINVLGAHGMRLRAQTLDRNGQLDEGANRLIESGWNRWFSGPVSADGTLAGLDYEEMALETVGREGESFPRRIVGEAFPDGLALQLIDPDLVDDNYNLQGNGFGSEVYMGIEVGAYGRRLAYHVLDDVYGPGLRGRGRQRIPAPDVLHLFRAARANQMRGVTWLARVMDRLHDVGRFSKNTLVASAAGAAQMGVIENSADSLPPAAVTNDSVTTGAAADAGGETSGKDPSAPRVAMAVEPGTVLELGLGQKWASYTPDQPHVAYGDYTTSVLREAAAGLGISYEALARDFSQVTYLSARAAMMIERAAYRRLQAWWIRVFRQPLFEWWLETAVLSGTLALPGDWRQYRDTLWIPRGFPWVDPVKDGLAAQQDLDLGLTTVTRLLAERGDDLEEVLREREREIALGKKYGIDLGPRAASTGAPTPAPSSGDEDEDPEGEVDDDPDETPYDAEAARKRAAKANGNGKRPTSRIAARR